MMMIMSRRLVAGVAVVGLVLAGCSGSSDTTGTDGTPPTELTIILPTTTTSTVPPPTVPPTTTATTTTSTSTTSSTTVAPDLTTTTEPNPAAAALVLTTVGIGSAEFGAEPEAVIGYISSFLGPPTEDTGWVDPFTICTISGNELRLVSWGSLTLTFGDVSTVLQERRHLIAYAYGFNDQIGVPPVGLVTDRGITVGSRVIDLLGAYPGVILNPEDDFFSPNFRVNDNLRGFLTGLADDDTVTVILGGIGCGE
jgi:hypothetical protein